MLILIWYLLSLIGVCEFGWMPVFIESLVAVVISMIRYCSDSYGGSSFGEDIVLDIYFGALFFSIYKLFCGLAISGWWVILSPVAAIIMLLVPGGFTITNLALKHFGLISSLPLWWLIVGIVLDIGTLFIVGSDIVDKIRRKRRR